MEELLHSRSMNKFYYPLRTGIWMLIKDHPLTLKINQAATPVGVLPFFCSILLIFFQYPFCLSFTYLQFFLQ